MFVYLLVSELSLQNQDKTCWTVEIIYITMAYEVLYWNMPMCQTRCEVSDSRKNSYSCTSPELNILEDAVWRPGHASANGAS